MNATFPKLRLMFAPVRRRGFTLVEVLVSLAIFAIAAVVLGAAYVNMLTNYQAAMQWGARQGELESLRAALQTEPDRLRVEKGGEQFLGDNRLARWRARVEETAIADLFQVTVDWEITAPDQAPAATGRQTFMLLRPTWSDPLVRARLRAESRQRLAKRNS